METRPYLEKELRRISDEELLKLYDKLKELRDIRLSWAELEKDLTLDEILEAFPDRIDLGGEAIQIFLVGRTVNTGICPKGHDIDVLFKADHLDPKVAKSFREQVAEKDPLIERKLHLILDSEGPLIGLAIPLYRSNEKVRRKEDELQKIKWGKPLGFMKPEKTCEFIHRFGSVWSDWAEERIKDGIFVSPKYDGLAFECVERGTPVFGPLKKIEEIEGEDRVLGKGLETKVLRTFEREYSGELIEIGSRGIKVKLTPEHPVLAIPSEKCKYPSKRMFCSPKCSIRCNYEPRWGPRWTKADHLKTSDWLFIPKVMRREDDYDRVLEIKRIGKWLRKEIPKAISLSDGFLELLGWYIAEGSANSCYGNISFALGTGERQEADRIKELFRDTFGINLAERRRDTRLELYTRSRSISAFLLSLVGKGARNKHLPDFAKLLSKRQISILLDALVKGDGVWGDSLSTSSKILAYQVFEILLSLGKLPSLGTVRPQSLTIKGNRTEAHEKYQVSWHWTGKQGRNYREDENGYWVRCKISRANYSGKVYNLETEGHVYSLPFLVHNCQKKGDKVWLITEDTEQDRASNLPDCVKEALTALKADEFIGHAELVWYKDEKFKEPHLRREMIRFANSPGEQDDSLVRFNMWDILWLDGKALWDLPWTEREKLLHKAIPKNTRHFYIQDGSVAWTKKDLRRLIFKYAVFPDSEGAMLKTLNSKYRIDGTTRSKAIAKYKNLKEIDTIVFGKHQVVREGVPQDTYNYFCFIGPLKEEEKGIFPEEELKTFEGKSYAHIGTSYNYGEKLSNGMILTVATAIVTWEEVKGGKRKLKWMFPQVIAYRPGKKEPDDLTFVKRVIAVGTKPLKVALELANREIYLYLLPCPYQDNEEECILKRRMVYKFGQMEEESLEQTEIYQQYLKYPIKCPWASIYWCPWVKNYYFGFALAGVV